TESAGGVLVDAACPVEGGAGDAAEVDRAGVGDVEGEVGGTVGAGCLGSFGAAVEQGAAGVGRTEGVEDVGHPAGGGAVGARGECGGDAEGAGPERVVHRLALETPHVGAPPADGLVYGPLRCEDRVHEVVVDGVLPEGGLALGVL